MYDDGPIEINKIKITDCDTVIFPGMKEMTMEKFFDFFEKMIKNYEITNCEFVVDKNTVNFKYDGNQYEINLKNTSSGMGVILLNLVKLESTLRKEKEYKEVIEKRRELLLKDARSGNIYSEEAKQLYVSELKKEVSFKGIFKGLKDFKYDAISEHDFLEYEMLSGLWLYFTVCTVLMVLLGLGLKVYLVSIISAILFVLQILEFREYGVGIIYSNVCFVIGMFKDNFFEELKMKKQKIKHLEKCRFPVNDDILKRVEREQFSGEVNEKVFEISKKLLSLNKMDRELMVYKLIKKIEENRKQKKTSKDNDFMEFLIEFEGEVDKIIGISDKDKESYAFTGNTRGMVVTENTTKVRRKI